MAMACKTSYDLHHNFPRLAEETGFAFNTHRPRVHIDWNKIRLIDVDSLTRDRKFVLLEQHVNDILDCVLESEFDVRILDEGVVKLFRLAQLAVEYQQFCRHYLDRSIFVLRQEIDTLSQELAKSKKDLQDKDEELRKLKKKGKPHYKPHLPYGNDNIAAMILKTLTTKGDMFPATTSGEVPQYNKCNYCDKVFLNQLYLKSHISRRHTNYLEDLPQKDVKEPEPTEVNKAGGEGDKLNDEINQLKLKIKEMEILITNNNKVLIDNEIIQSSNRINDSKPKEMKDVEVYTNNEDVFQKLEEWKKTEQENHSKEINLLRNQIFETLNNLKAKELVKPNDSIEIEQLNGTIKDQGAEISSLKQALTQSKLKIDTQDKDRKKEFEEQMLFWAKRDEAQSKQHELLLQKLKEVAQEARESRAVAEAERLRARQLEALLKKHLSNNKLADDSSDGDSVSNTQEEIINDNKVPALHLKVGKKPKLVADHNTLEQLHRKAQELLNMESSSSSDASGPEFLNNQQTVKLINRAAIEKHTIKSRTKNPSKQSESDTPPKNINKEINKTKAIENNNKSKIDVPKQNKKKDLKKNKMAPKPSAPTQENGPILPLGSPKKVVRAKITEEVNSRLIQAGVDPLKIRLNQSVFHKQKTQLQHQLEIKAKKYPAYEKVRYSIMAYLDSDAANKKRDVLENGITSQNTLTKAFSLSSMISNVKTKALSLVKNKELKKKNESKSVSSNLAKKALSILNSPTQSPAKAVIRRSSPTISDSDDSDIRQDLEPAVINKTTTHLVKRKMVPTQSRAESDSDGSKNSNDAEAIVAIPQRPARSIDNLIKSPARRPSSASADYSNTVFKYTINRGNNEHLLRTQSATNISKFEADDDDENDQVLPVHKAATDDIQSLLETNMSKSSPKHTKGVLKNASSTSSLNKKKVIFDMDAIQMKSVSASPSQSITEKSDDKYELGLINIADDEWDISSIDNEPIKNDTMIRVNSGQSPKIAELKQTIEAQLARRSETPSTALFGGVDVLRGPMTKSSNIGGSNTSLGSSIFDDSDSAKVVNQKTINIVKSKKNAEKDDSELDISDFSIDGVTNKNEKDSF